MKAKQITKRAQAFFCLFTLAAAASAAAGALPDAPTAYVVPGGEEEDGSIAPPPDCYIETGETFTVTPADSRTYKSLTADGATIRNSGSVVVMPDRELYGDIVFTGGTLYEATNQAEGAVNLVGGKLLLSQSRISLQAFDEKSDNYVQVTDLEVKGESRIALLNACKGCTPESKNSVSMSVWNTMTVVPDARLELIIGQNASFAFGGDETQFTVDEFRFANVMHKGLLLIGKPFELTKSMHIQVGGDAAADLALGGDAPNLVLGADGVLMLQPLLGTGAAGEAAQGEPPCFSAAQGTSIRFEEGAAIWLSTAAGADLETALGALDLSGAEIEGLGNVEVRYDGQIGWFNRDQSGNLTVSFEPMRFSGPFAGMLEALWAQRHDVLMPGFFRAIFDRAQVGAGEEALLQASTLAAKLGSDQRLAHLHDRAAAESGFIWFEADDANPGSREAAAPSGEANAAEAGVGLDGWRKALGPIPVRVMAWTARIEDTAGAVGSGAGRHARNRISSDDLTIGLSTALGRDAWRFGLSAYFLSSDIRTSGSPLGASAEIPMRGTSDTVLVELWGGRRFVAGTALLSAAWSEAADEARTTNNLKSIEVDDLERRVLSLAAAWRTPDARLGPFSASLTTRVQYLRFEGFDYAIKADGETFLNAETVASNTVLLAADLSAEADVPLWGAKPKTGAAAFFADLIPRRACWQGTLGFSYFAGGLERELRLRAAGYDGTAVPQAHLTVDGLDRLLLRASTSVALEFDETRLSLEGFGARSDDEYRAYGAGIRCEWRY